MEYEKIKTIEYPTAIVRVHRPILTDAVRQKRKLEFETATAEFMKAVLKEREKE